MIEHRWTIHERITWVYLAIVMVVTILLATPAIAAKEIRITDREISMAVEGELIDDPAVSGYVIDASTDDGIVSLTGEVDNLLARQRAARIARTVKGVRSVVNQIEVKKSDLPDGEVEADVEMRLLSDPATQGWQIEAEVDTGIVTLTGEVGSMQEKFLAEKVVKGVRGVCGVTNEIIVDIDEVRPEHEVRSEIERLLHWDVLIDDAKIDVAVEDSTVTLSGSVGSAAEKARAVTKAYVAGVARVKSENLDVEKWARDPMFRKEKYAEKPDSEIQKAVREALEINPRVNGETIEVSCADGVVTLDGTVSNLKSKRSAARTARHTVGVWRVKNRIEVRPSSPTDREIITRIKEAYRTDPYVNLENIRVQVRGGVVTLSGYVDTYFQKAQADDLASRVYGVVRIKNSLRVNSDFDIMTDDPFVDTDWQLDDFDWYGFPNEYSSTRSDWVIKEQIIEEIQWSPYLDIDSITVQVDNGAATLTGVVDTWQDRERASDEAYDGGAVTVDNNIRVRFGPEE